MVCYLLSSCSKHYPLYSLNVASMWLKLGRLYMGLEDKDAGEKALKKVRLQRGAVGPGTPRPLRPLPSHLLGPSH